MFHAKCTESFLMNCYNGVCLAWSPNRAWPLSSATCTTDGTNSPQERLRLRGGGQKGRNVIFWSNWKLMIPVGLGFLLAFMYQSGSPYSHHVIEKREFTYANTPFPLSLWTNLAKVIRTMMHTSSSKLPTDLTSAMALAMPTNLMDSYYLVAID
jgi:hypothetical protein